MRIYFRLFIHLVVAISFSASQAGSYDDFFVAIIRDDSRTVSQLLARGFDPNTPSPQGQHGLYLALRDASLGVAGVLVEAPATRVDVRNLDDETPLMMAALKGQVAMVRRLLAREADVNKPGWTPLHYAATGGNVEVIRLLLDAHAYIDAESPNGTTPLMMAARYGSEEAVKLLLEAGADPTIRNQQRMSAQDFALGAGREPVAGLIAAAIRRRQPVGTW